MSNKITLLPEYIDIVQQPNSNFYKVGTNLMDAFSTFAGELSTNIEFEKSKVNNDVIDSSTKLYNKLNDTDFTIDVDGIEFEFDNIFKLFFIEKFQSLTNDLKTLITSNFTGTNTYFVNFSDDIGSVTNTKNIINTSTSPFHDLESEALPTKPHEIPGSVYNKVSQNELITSIKLNQHSNILLKRNLQGLVDYTDLNIAKKSHGSNLVADSLHVDRAFKYKASIQSGLKNVLGKMSDFVQFFQLVNFNDRDSSRKADFIKYQTDIEGTRVKIDLLKNKLEKSIPNTLAVAPSAQDTVQATPDATISGTTIE